MTEQTPSDAPTGDEDNNDDVIIVPRERYDEIVEKLANAEQSTANLVSEIKDLREKKQITEAEAEELRKQVEGKSETPSGSDPLSPEKIAEITSQTVSKILSEKKEADAKNALSEAIQEFQSGNKEFHPDNDQGGLKMSKIQSKLEQFNLNGFSSKAEFSRVLADAKRLVSNSNPKIEDNAPEIQDVPESSPNQPKAGEGDKLSEKELKLIQNTFNGDKERYMKIKDKRPEYVAQILQYQVN